ncbi:hypothetical protein JW868_04195 [Candidatus Woesearchaeota archaeon]|nr:hypothetical protein [Candidatus Woesearchaeota archaeon]
MSFNNDKKQCLVKLEKHDKSIKGSIDGPISNLVNYINSLKDYYTTSSCSGRIVLFKEGRSKPDADWLFVSHEIVNANELISSLDGIRSLDGIPKEVVWLRQEGLILHVRARSIDDANRLLKIVRDIGLKRSGIISMAKKGSAGRIMVEITTNEKMDVPISHDGKLVVSHDQIEFFVRQANRKMERNFELIKNLEKEVKRLT